MPEEKRVRKQILILCFALILSICLTSCQAFVAGRSEPLSSTKVAEQTSTPASHANALWVDTTHDLGKSSKFVLGANHGPWSDLENGGSYKITEAYLFDAIHKAESIAVPDVTNGQDVSLPAESVTLYIFK